MNTSPECTGPHSDARECPVHAPVDQAVAPRRMRVWHIPQVPMKAFRVEVKTLEEAKLLVLALCEYDLFQFNNKIKPDYCNACGLEVFEDGEWLDYEDDEGRTVEELISMDEALRKRVVDATRERT